MELETLEIAVVTLLLIISAVGVVVRYWRLPYPIALVLTGLAIGALSRGALPILRDLPLEEVRLTPKVILLLLLPALLFEATLHIEVTALRRTLLPVTFLAVPGVLVNAAIVGALIHWGVGLAWPIALLFGAIVAATDRIAVLAIFKKLHAPLVWSYWLKVKACSTTAPVWCWPAFCKALCWRAASVLWLAR